MKNHLYFFDKEKASKIINLEDYLNTGKPVVLGVRPEDLHDDESSIKKFADSIMKIRVEVVERLGAETLLYCVFGEKEETEEGVIQALDDDIKQIIAKVDSRSTTQVDEMVNLGVDIIHAHLFDKETELSILEGEGTKAYVPEVELERLAKAAEEKAAKEAAKAEKIAAKEAAKAAKVEKTEE